MKKIVNIIKIINILVIFNLTKDTNILPLTISFSLHILYSGIFSSTSIKEIIENYHKNKNNYLRDKIFKCSIITITSLGVILGLTSYLIGNILNIDKLNIINIFMTISVISNILIKIIKEYIEVIGYKKISNNIINIYTLITLIINIILSILMFNVFKINNSLTIIILYSVNTLVFIILSIILYTTIFKKLNRTKSQQKEKILNQIKKVLIQDKKITTYNIIKSAYIYSSIIILFYILKNKYSYNIDEISLLITNTYLYGLIVINYIYKLINKYINPNYNNIKETFNNSINKIIKVSLNITILLIIISKPLSIIILNNNYNFLSAIIPILLFYILYDYLINISLQNIKERNIIITLLFGLIIKIIFELPLINTIYRMGYSLVLGSILSIILGLIVSIILSIIFIKNKFKINLLNNFNNLLNIIYESIIYTLVIVLCTFIVKVDTNTLISSVLVVIFYLFITIIFHIIERILTKK